MFENKDAAFKYWQKGYSLPMKLLFLFSVIIQMKLEYLWGQLANLDQILYEHHYGGGRFKAA